MPIPPAYMGYIGYVRISSGMDYGIRCTSCELKLSQTIEKQDVVSSRFDKTVYRLGPKEIGGTIAFPAVMDPGLGGVGSTDVVARLWLAAIQRNNDGRMVNVLEPVKVKYTSDNATFNFHNCKVNTFKFSVAQSDVINIETEVFGTSREYLGSGGGYLTDAELGGERNARAMTWNDVYLEVVFEGGSFTGEYVRTFECNINNNLDRFYTLNGCLSPQDIAPKLRDITGSLVVMGRHPGLGQDAEDNQERCFADHTLHFGYYVSGCSAQWGVKLPGVVYEIETMGLKNDLMESTVNWHSLPGGRASETFVDTDFIINKDVCDANVF